MLQPLVRRNRPTQELQGETRQVKRSWKRMWGMGWALLLLSLTVMTWAEGALPQDLAEASLEELGNIKVYTASKHLQPMAEAPSSVTIITRDEIEKYGYLTLADMLRSVRGFYVTYDRNYAYVGVRGFARPGDYNTRVLLLVNGHRLNDGGYDMAPIGNDFPVDVDLIERVEVVRGPSSSLYGTNAFFGVINVITRQAGGFPQMEASFEPAGLGTYKGRLSFRQRVHGAEVLLSATAMDSQGGDLYFAEFDTPETNHGVAHGLDGERYYSGFANLAWRKFTLEGVYGWREKTVPTASFGTVFNDPRTASFDSQRYGELRYEDAWGAWSLSTRAYYDEYHYDGTYAYDYGLYKDYGHMHWLGEEGQVSTTRWSKHRVTAGWELRHNLQLKQEGHDESPYYQYLYDNRSTTVVAGFVQDEYAVWRDLIVNAGLRFDQYQAAGETVNPRIAVIYRPRLSSTVKLLYGQAFRAPNALETYYEGGGYIKNERLRPEKIRSMEVVWEQGLGGRFQLLSTVYHNSIQDLINQVEISSDGGFQYQNMGRVSSMGAELELKGKTANGVEMRTSWGLQVTKDRLTDERLTNSPQNLAKLNLIVPLYHHQLFASLDAQYTGRRITLAGGHAGGAPVFNMTLVKRNLGHGLDLGVSVYNILDKRLVDPRSEEHVQDVLQQDGRNFRVKLTYRWGKR